MIRAKLFFHLLIHIVAHDDVLRTPVLAQRRKRFHTVRIRLDARNIRIEHHPGAQLLIDVEHTPLCLGRITIFLRIAEGELLDAEMPGNRGDHHAKREDHRQNARRGVQPRREEKPM